MAKRSHSLGELEMPTTRSGLYIDPAAVYVQVPYTIPATPMIPPIENNGYVSPMNTPTRPTPPPTGTSLEYYNLDLVFPHIARDLRMRIAFLTNKPYDPLLGTA